MCERSMSDETIVLIWCSVSALAWVTVGSWIALKRRDGLHPAAIFCMLFALSYPLKFIATGYGFATLNSLALGAEWQLGALALANVSAVMFVVPVVLRARSL